MCTKQIPVHSSAPSRHTSCHHYTPLAAPTCFHLHCIACSQVYSAVQSLHCTALRCNTALQCDAMLHKAADCLSPPVAVLEGNSIRSICCTYKYLLCFSLFEESVVLRATVQRGRPLTCSGSGCCGTLQQLNIHETSPKIRNN